jgi:hypothetical protein
MTVDIPLQGRETHTVVVDVDSGVAAAPHLDGVVLWSVSPGFESFADLAPVSVDGPCARGGLLFLRAQPVEATEVFEQSARRILLPRAGSQKIDFGVWNDSELLCARVNWTDGVSDVTSAVVRWCSDALLVFELSRNRHWEARTVGAAAVERDLLAAVHPAE